jgi:hypothetical protein
MQECKGYRYNCYVNKEHPKDQLPGRLIKRNVVEEPGKYTKEKWSVEIIKQFCAEVIDMAAYIGSQFLYKQIT